MKGKTEVHGKKTLKVERGIDRLKKQCVCCFQRLGRSAVSSQNTVCDSEELSPTQSIPTMQDKLSDANATIGAARNRD